MSKIIKEPTVYKVSPFLGECVEVAHLIGHGGVGDPREHPGEPICRTSRKFGEVFLCSCRAVIWDDRDRAWK